MPPTIAAFCITITAHANGMRQRFDKVIPVMCGDPYAKRNGVWSGHKRPVAKRMCNVFNGTVGGSLAIKTIPRLSLGFRV